MPELGESVTEGTVTRWLKKVGDKVEVDEPLVEVSTDKVDTEIPSPVAGTLLSITAEEDDTVAVGGELAKIGEPRPRPAEKPEPEPERKPSPSPSQNQSRSPRPNRNPSPSRSPSRRRNPHRRRRHHGDGTPYVTPLVRKLASENNVDLAKVKGTGVGGRIRKQDVLAAAEAGQGTGAPKPSRKRGTGDPAREGTGRGAGTSARHHAEGQPDPSAHREEDTRILAGHSATHANPRGRHDQDRGAAVTREERVRRTRGRQPDVPAVLRRSRRSTR